jgi:hypothetical protein
MVEGGTGERHHGFLVQIVAGVVERALDICLEIAEFAAAA